MKLDNKTTDVKLELLNKLQDGLANGAGIEYLMQLSCIYNKHSLIMRHIDRINKQYEEKEVKLLYDKAVALMNLLSDEEYEQVITDNADIFKLASHPEKGEFYLQDKHNLVQIIDIFSKFIKTKGLSKDEFKIMTLDEVKEYMVNVINDITSFEPESSRIIKDYELAEYMRDYIKELYANIHMRDFYIRNLKDEILHTLKHRDSISGEELLQILNKVAPWDMEYDGRWQTRDYLARAKANQ